MKTRFLSLLALTSVLSFSSCGDSAKRTDGTAGEAVSDLDKAATDGGVEADATVIDNDAGPTVTADADSATATDSAAGARP